MYIPRDTIELIREKVNIEEIIKRYVPSLIKKGRNYLGLCPFHKEKTPSFTVSPEKQIFYCFGCHAGGNIFTFISKIERMNFLESVKYISEIVGVDIIEDNKRDSSRSDEINNINNLAMNFFHNFIKSNPGKKGLDYLIGRGVLLDSIDEFKIGYAPESWDFLFNYLKNSNLNIPIAENIGLISTSTKNNQKHYFDKFRNRVIFPIFDKNNRVIAFGGRIIGEGNPKYLNSPESEVFQKRTVLYGFNKAKDFITDLNRVIIVEGYLDVIGCHQAGIKNVVAPLGTALTSYHVQMLSRICGEIILLFDADSAGIKAAVRSLDIVNESNIDVRIAMLPEGDPFEFINTQGMREFMSVVDSAMRPIDFRISRIMEKYEHMGRVNTLLQLFSVIKDIKYETERSFYIKKIATLINLDENSIRADFSNYIKKQEVSNQIIHKENKDSGKDDFITRSFKDLIKLICYYPQLIEKAVIDYAEYDIPDAILKSIFKKMLELYYSEETFSVDKLFDFFHDDSEINLLNQIINTDYTVENPNAVYTEIYINMKLHEIDNKIDKYAGLIKNSTSVNPQEYITEIEVLRREKEKLSHYIYNKFMH